MSGFHLTLKYQVPRVVTKKLTIMLQKEAITSQTTIHIRNNTELEKKQNSNIDITPTDNILVKELDLEDPPEFPSQSPLSLSSSPTPLTPKKQKTKKHKNKKKTKKNKK